MQGTPIRKTCERIFHRQFFKQAGVRLQALKLALLSAKIHLPFDDRYAAPKTFGTRDLLSTRKGLERLNRTFQVTLSLAYMTQQVVAICDERFVAMAQRNPDHFLCAEARVFQTGLTKRDFCVNPLRNRTKPRPLRIARNGRKAFLMLQSVRRTRPNCVKC